MKVLVIEDDVDIAEVMALSFRMGWPQSRVISTEQGEKGIEMVETESPDIVLLDLCLPDKDGLDVLSEIRTFSDVPVIIITVRGEEMERVRGLEMGADDYVVKPFSYMELLARVRAVLRRRSADGLALTTTLEDGGLVIDFRSQEVKLHGDDIQLTPIEYRLLCELVGKTGQTVSQKTLVENIWGEAYLDTPSVLKVHIHRLRRKLGDTADRSQMISTVSGRGYKFNASVSQLD